MMTDEFSSSGSPTPSVDGAGNSSRRQILSDSASTTATSSLSAQTLLELVGITQAPALTGLAAAAAAADENQVAVVESSDGGNVGGGAVPSSADVSSVPVPDVSIAPPQGPVVVSNTQQKHAKPNAYSNNNYNHGNFNRQKSIKQTVGGGSIGFMRPPPPPPLPPPFPMFEIPYPRPVSNQFSYHRGRHDQDMPRDWNGPRGSMHMPRDWNGPRGSMHMPRDWNGPRGSIHMPQDWNGPRGSPHQMVPPHTGAPPFFAPQPFGNPNPMGFGMPPHLYVPPQPMFPVMDGPPLTTLILNQIDYYFSETNLVTDKFLKDNMDRDGWVPISLIAGFRRMDRLAKNFHLKNEEFINLILESLRNSKVVEVQGGKLRPRKNWEKWVATSANGPRQGEPSNSSPVIEDATTKPNTTVGLSSPSSETVDLSDSEQQESTTATSKLAIAEDNCNGNRNC